MVVTNTKSESHKVEETMSDKPSKTMTGTVEKITKSLNLGESEKAQVALHGTDDLFRRICFDNKLNNNNGDEVRLTQGLEVKVTIEANAEDTNPARKN